MANDLAILPPSCRFRSAEATDIWTIRKLVLLAKLDPTQLRWQQFWVIECEQRIIACGQLRNYGDAQELGSLIVTPDWQGRGLGTYLAQQLIEKAEKPLYLECVGDRLAKFYQRLGFVPVVWQVLPPSLRRKFGVTKFAATVFRLPVFIMHYCPSQMKQDNSDLI